MSHVAVWNRLVYILACTRQTQANLPYFGLESSANGKPVSMDRVMCHLSFVWNCYSSQRIKLFVHQLTNTIHWRKERRGHATPMPTVKTSKSLLLLRIALSVINYCCNIRRINEIWRHNTMADRQEHCTHRATRQHGHRERSLYIFATVRYCSSFSIVAANFQCWLSAETDKQ